MTKTCLLQKSLKKEEKEILVALRQQQIKLTKANKVESDAIKGLVKAQKKQGNLKPLPDSGDPENVFAYVYFSGHGCSDDK